MTSESTWDESIVLDVAHLDGYTGGDTELAREVLKIFIDNAPSYLADLGDADCQSWRSSAHKLKGAARGIGAWRLARAAERAEFLGEPAANDDRRVAILKEMSARLEQLKERIQSF
ncbi:MAG: Hpt domain-containing protein [Alphaproteobacteria bacterium]|nr:Hpt domain-containing protein [Alphaproteobacteria bacterium]